MTELEEAKANRVTEEYAADEPVTYFGMLSTHVSTVVLPSVSSLVGATK